MANWDTETSSGDSVSPRRDPLLRTANGPAPTYNGLYIYDNRFDGTVGQEAPTAQIFIEGNFGASSATPAPRPAPRSYVFNNIFGSTDYPTSNGYLETSQPGGGVYNNTIVGVSNTDNLGSCSGYRAKRQRHHRRVPKQPAQHLRLPHRRKPRPHFTAGSPDYNVYANGGENSFTCNNNYYTFAQFRSWRFCVNADRHSRRSASARLDERGAPERGSPVIGAGVNLTYLCKGPLVPLCTDIAGVRRPKRGPWNAGAY